MNFQWLGCLRGLNAARDLDPTGDGDPVAIAARDDAMSGAMATEKPGGRFVPRGRRVYGPWASR